MKIDLSHNLRIDVGPDLVALVEEILEIPGPRMACVAAFIREKSGGFVALVTGKDIEGIRMDTKQKADITIVPTDRRGDPAPVENPTLTTDNPDLVIDFDGTQDPATYEIKAVVHTPATGSGVAAVEFNADPKIGSDVGQLHGGLAVSWSPPEATEVTMTLGDATDDAGETPAPPVE